MALQRGRRSSESLRRPISSLTLNPDAGSIPARHHFVGGASTPEKTSTWSGRRAPRISIAETDAFSSASSGGVNRTEVAPMFSSMCAICVVPGMGTIQGFRAISHARAIRAGVARFRSAHFFTRLTRTRLWGRFSGEKRDSTQRMSPSANRVRASVRDQEARHGSPRAVPLGLDPICN